MNPLLRDALVKAPMISAGELAGIASALEAGKAYGYGNIMAWLATAWAVELRDREGFSEKDAIEIVSGRGPYPLPKRSIKAAKGEA